jgi:hypothetical protein
MNLASDQFGYLFVLAQEPIPSDVDPYRDAIALRLEQVFPFGGLVGGDYFDMLARGTLAAPAAFAATPEGEVFARTGGLRADLTYVSHFPAEGGSPEALRTDRWPIYSPRTGEVEFASRKYAVADAEGDYYRLLAEPGDPTDGSGQWTITIGKYTSSEVLLGSVTIPGPLTPPGGWVEPGEPAAALGADGNLRIALAVYRSAQYSELEPFGVLWVGTVSTQGDLLHAWTDESFPPGAVSAIAVDPGGSVYVVGDAAWKYTASGERVGRIGGWGGAGDQRDAPGSLLRYANGVAMDEVGRLRVQDIDAGRLLEFAYTPAPFSDVPYWHWAKEAIRAVQEAGVAVGYADGRYAPEETVSRDQMAVYLARALAGSDAAVPAGPDQPRFRDVPTSHWAYRYIEYVAEQGIVDGYWDGSYRPALEVDRGQMAVFISRALAGSDEAVPPGPIAPSFSDVPTSHWAFRHVEYAKAQGVVGGYWDGTYRPDFAVTRDQMAVYVQRAFDLPQ